jgi:hypothetical protein
VTRAQLEAALWRIWPGAAPAQIDATLTAADAYASGDSPELTELRRQVLRRDALRGTGQRVIGPDGPKTTAPAERDTT